jgi:hypothetical protein
VALSVTEVRAQVLPGSLSMEPGRSSVGRTSPNATVRPIDPSLAIYPLAGPNRSLVRHEGAIWDAAMR